MIDLKRGTGAGTIEAVQSDMRVVEIDPHKIGRDGYLMIGQKVALERWMHVLQKSYAATRDRQEKRILEDILSGMFEDMERIEVRLAEIAQSRNALKFLDQPVS